MRYRWPTAQWNTHIVFAAGEHANSKSFLIDGWADQERLGVSTKASMARLAFSLSRPQHEVFLTLQVTPFLKPPIVTQQSLEVLLNGVSIGRCELVFSQQTVLIFPVDRRLLEQRQPSIITLLLSGSCSSQQPGLMLHSLYWSDIVCAYQVGTEIPVTTRYPVNPFLLYGWSWREDGYTWTDGNVAGLLLHLSEPREDLVLRAMVQPFHPLPDPHGLPVGISINERPAGKWWLTNGVSEYQNIRLPKGIIGNSGYVYIRFDIENPRSPRELGLSSDPRRLGFQLSSFCLESDEVSTIAASSNVSRSESTTHGIFLEGSALENALIYGWKFEPDGARTVRSMAVLSLDLQRHETGLVIDFRLRGPGFQSSVEIAVSVLASESWVGGWNVKSCDFQDYVLQIPPELINRAGRTHLKLMIHDRHDRMKPISSDGITLQRLRAMPRERARSPIVTPILQSGHSVSFTPNDSGLQFLANGWSCPDSQGVNNICSRPSLEFRINGVRLPADIVCNISPNQDGGALTMSELTAVVNGRVAAHWKFDRFASANLSIKLHAIDLLKEDLIRMQFIISPPPVRTAPLYAALKLQSMRLIETQ